jgi:hypothetical protein
LADKTLASPMFITHGVCCPFSNFDFPDCQIPKSPFCRF